MFVNVLIVCNTKGHEDETYRNLSRVPCVGEFIQLVPMGGDDDEVEQTFEVIRVIHYVGEHHCSAAGVETEHIDCARPLIR